MDTHPFEVSLHPGFLNALFALKSPTMNIFRDVLGLHNIHHLSISQVDCDGRLMSFSSTPAMEFNLFNSALWRYDHCYQAQWFTQSSQACWGELYETKHFDELYYLKQVKHGYYVTRCLAENIDGEAWIYGMASQNHCWGTEDRFVSEVEEFYKIGQYCADLLRPYFVQCQGTPDPIR